MCISALLLSLPCVMFCAGAKWENKLTQPVLWGQLRCGSSLTWVGVEEVLGMRAFHILDKYSVTSIPKKCFCFKQHSFPIVLHVFLAPCRVPLFVFVSVMLLGAITGAEVTHPPTAESQMILCLLSPSITCKTGSSDELRVYGFGDRPESRSKGCSGFLFFSSKKALHFSRALYPCWPVF